MKSMKSSAAVGMSLARSVQDGEPVKQKLEKMREYIKKNDPPGFSISDICSSKILDEMLAGDPLSKIKFEIPECSSVDFVTLHEDIDAPGAERKVLNTGGLGLKRKEVEKEAAAAAAKNGGLLSPSATAWKAKTLLEKRFKLQEDVMRYGVAAIEKMYPRQQHSRRRLQAASPKTPPKRIPIKMKPKPAGIDFDEVDVGKILHPNSHSKYIHEPEFDSMVYIERPGGIVPLSSLCPKSSTVMSANCKLLSERNLRLGKPKLFVRDKGRLVAIGGSRSSTHDLLYAASDKAMSIVNCPKPAVVDEEGKMVKKNLKETFVPFEMSAEYVESSVAAVDTEAIKLAVAKAEERKRRNVPERVDIRQVKRAERLRRLANRSLKDVLDAERRTITSHLMEKLKAVADATGEEMEEAEREAAWIAHVAAPKDGASNEGPIEEAPGEVPAGVAASEGVIVEKVEGEEKIVCEIDENPEREEGFKSQNPVHNLWSENKNHAQLPDLITDKPFISEEFKAGVEDRKKKRLAGFDVCDIGDCFCKEEPGLENEVTAATSATTETVSGIETPVASDGPDFKDQEMQKKKVDNSLKKVRRALKTLGVNFYEFDDKSGEDCTQSKYSVCDKDYCRLGCICDTLTGKPVAATHCGKAECMFRCFCSEEALKIAAAAALSPNGTRRSASLGISAEGCVAKLRSTNTRRMAAEEKKFNNTVVAATGGTGSTTDYLMLGATAGRQRRERKVPTRYQDSDVFSADYASFGSGVKSSGVEAGLDHAARSSSSVLGFSRGELVQSKRMLSDGIRDETISRVAVLVPMIGLPDDTKVWCMYHLRYSCPCGDYKDPLDFGPDLSASRNVSKRTGSKVFKTKKRKVTEDGNERPVKRKAVRTKPVDKSQFDFELHCARTSGLFRRKHGAVRMPHTVVVKIKKREGDEPKPEDAFILKVSGKKVIKASGLLTNIQNQAMENSW